MAKAASPVRLQVVDPESVFDVVEADRRSGELSKKVSTAPIRYQASITHPGYLEQIDEKGNCTIGTFCGGVFSPIDGDAD